MCPRVLDVLAGLFAKNQVTRVEEQARQQTVSTHLIPRSPLPDGFAGPPRPETTVRSIAVGGPDTARLPPRGLARIAGAVGINHRNPGAQSL